MCVCVCVLDGRNGAHLGAVSGWRRASSSDDNEARRTSRWRPKRSRNASQRHDIESKGADARRRLSVPCDAATRADVHWLRSFRYFRSTGCPLRAPLHASHRLRSLVGHLAVDSVTRCRKQPGLSRSAVSNYQPSDSPSMTSLRSENQSLIDFPSPWCQVDRTSGNITVSRKNVVLK